MSKGDRNRERNARDRIAAQQAAAKQAERRRVLLIGGGSLGLVVVVVLVFIFIALNKKQAGSGALPASVVRNLTSVPVGTLASVGGGSVLTYNPQPVKALTDKPLISAGKPEMLYIGAEFCPFCAAQRWAMAVALSRFGTFGPLRGIHSSSTDEFPNTATLTFYKTAYTSPYLTFTPIENETVTRTPLQPVTASQQAIWFKYSPGGGFPFVYLGGNSVIVSPLVNPAIMAGLTWAQIARQLHNPASQVGQGADGAANYITAAICRMTSNKPASVCTAAPIPAIESKI